MALSQDEIRKSAERLDQAEKSRKQIRQLSLEHPGMTIEDAYAIQKAWVEIKVAAGRTVKGHKIGLTSKAMQSALNIDEPDSGILPASWKRPDWPPACSTIRQRRWPGSPTRSRRMGWHWKQARWCWRDRSSARSRPAKATRSRPTMVPMVR